MVYLHVPFCRSFCTYCDFYSEIACRGRDAQLFEAYTDAVCAEASRRRDEIEATRDLDTLYIGGGTPSVLPLSLLRKIISFLMSGGVPPELVEFTIEVNPEDIVERGPEYVRGLLGLGVNRVSMGVQSLDDGILRWMNRRHDAAHARQAFRILRGAGVDNVSVDLIFGLSQLSLQTLDATVSEILEWRPEHISAYQLSIEEDSALGEMVRLGRYIEAPQEQCAAQYALLCKRLRAAGYVHYEISNWALPGREAVHNSAYWARHPYVGLGPGAHSFDGTRRSWNAACLRQNGELPPETSGCAGPLPSDDGPLEGLATGAPENASIFGVVMPRVARFPEAVTAPAMQAVIWWPQNWRKGGLQERRNEVIREQGFYNQNWCGCEFSRHDNP